MRFEERMAKRMSAIFDRLPGWLRVLFGFWLLVDGLTFFTPGFLEALPDAIRLVLFAPMAALVVFVGIPLTVVAFFRLFTWPFRKAAQAWGRAH